MKVIKHPSFARAKAKRLFQIAAISGGLVLAGLTIGQIHKPFAIPGLYTLPFSFLLFGTTITRARDAQRGQSGEDRTAKTLSSLGDDYTLIRNLQLGEKQGDIDFILLGPFGALVLEQKANSVSMKCEGDNWSYKVSETYWKRTKSYSRQLKRNVKAVEKLLKMPCYGAIVFNNGVDLTTKEPTVEILLRRNLLNYIQALPNRNCQADKLTTALNTNTQPIAA